MQCHENDWKAYLLEELPPAERSRLKNHLGECAGCAAEYERLSLTLTALRRLPEVEMPRRIAFVSDPVFEPSWWRRFWSSAPRLAFAGMAMLALAIVVHAYAPRQAATQGVDEAKLQAMVEQQVQARLTAAVDQRVRETVLPLVQETARKAAESQSGAVAAQLVAELDQKLKSQRKSDLATIGEEFDLIQRRMGMMYVTASRQGGE